AGYLMRRVARAGTEIEKEGPVRGDDLRIPDELERGVGQVFRQVVAGFGPARWPDRMVVVHQLREILAGLAAEKPVEPLEPSPERPTSVAGSGGHLAPAAQVPLSHRVGIPAVRDEHLGKGGALGGDVAA